MACLLFCNCVCTHVGVFLCVYFYILYTRKDLNHFRCFFPKFILSQRSSLGNSAWKIFISKPLKQMRTGKQSVCVDLDYGNCYQRFSVNLLSNFSREIINKTPVSNLCMS